MPQGPSANPEKFSPPGPWSAQGAVFPGANLEGVLDVPPIVSATVVYGQTLEPGPAPPFIASTTVVRHVDLTGNGTITFDTSDIWVCPEDVTSIKVEARGGGGGGSTSTTNGGHGAGGGGAYAATNQVPVTPGFSYTITVGSGGAAGGTGGTSTFTGDSSVVVSAVGGSPGADITGGAGGTTAASTGNTKWAGGKGGDGYSAPATGGAGGGEGAGSTENGHDGEAATDLGEGKSGGTSGDGGDGGHGGHYFTNTGITDGQVPGGGGGGGGGFAVGSSGGGGRIEITFNPPVLVPFRASTTVLYSVTEISIVDVPFVGSVSTVYTPALGGNVDLSFIASTTTVFAPHFVGVVPKGQFRSKLGLARLGQFKLGDNYHKAAPRDCVVPFLGSASAVYALEQLIGTVDVPFLSSSTVVYAPTQVDPYVFPPFIVSTTTVYTPVVQPDYTDVPFIASTTTVFALTAEGDIVVPFIGSVTVVYAPVPQPDYIDVPFIPSATLVFAPDVQSNLVRVPFIPSAAYVHPPDVSHVVVVTDVDVPFIPSATVVFALVAQPNFLDVPFRASTTVLFTPVVQPDFLEVPFIASRTVLFEPYDQPDFTELPFIETNTHVFTIVSIWRDSTGPGNGGELFMVQLAPGGTEVTVQLDGAINSSTTSLTLSGAISGLIPGKGFVVTIEDEVIYVGSLSGLSASQLVRGMSNTVPAAHADGSDVTWNDTYDLAVVSQVGIAETAEIDDNTLLGWVTVLDCSQGYVASGDRYAANVNELLGVFGPGDTVSKVDRAQPASISAIAGLTDRVPVSLTRPARLIDDVDIGDVALCRYINAEDHPLILGPRSILVQTWYGLVRVDDANHEDNANPGAHILDGDTSEVFENNNVLTTATLDSDERYWTNPTRGFSDKAILMSGLAIRHGRRRIPLWTSPNWHNFDFVYSGFGDDCNFVQIIAKRRNLEGIIPGTGDIAGPNATWDDFGYQTSTAWHVVLTSFDGIALGPGIGSPPVAPPLPSTVPIGVVVVPPTTGGPGGGGVGGTGGEEGGSGGNISPGMSAPVLGVYFDSGITVDLI